ncbi:MAG: AAA family ATPase [Candidatus Micrarchaeota archaeon]|nr:AAA family ATPase [Candidatus Micrarchaeota archaeon]
MPKFIITTGTPGSGKSTILKQISDVKIVSLADEMLSVAQKGSNGLTDRDKLRSLSDEEIVKIRAAALRHINSMRDNSIIDTHASVKKGTRYVPGLTMDGLGSLNRVEAIIYIDATADEIINRRKKDKTRVREEESKGEIEEQRIVNISLISAFAFSLSIPIYIVDNKEGKVDFAVAEVKRIAKEVFGK